MVIALLVISVPIGLYGFQHYLSILGSLILIPLVIVPAMGGNYVSTCYSNSSYLPCCKFSFFWWTLFQQSWTKWGYSVGRHSKCGFQCAIHVWSDNTFTYITGFKIAIDSRAFICLSRPCSCNNQFSWIFGPKWKCMYVMMWFIHISFIYFEIKDCESECPKICLALMIISLKIRSCFNFCLLLMCLITYTPIINV